MSILHCAWEQCQITFRGSPFGLKTDFFSETLQLEQRNIVQVLTRKKKRSVNPEYFAVCSKTLVQIKGEITDFPRQIEIGLITKEVLHTQKIVSITKEDEGRKSSKSTKVIQSKQLVFLWEFGRTKLLPIITLSVSGLNSPSKRYSWTT